MRLLSEGLITDSASLSLARSRVRASARRLQFSQKVSEAAQLVCSEILNNQLKHVAYPGIFQIWELTWPDKYLDFFALDCGGGIRNIVEALTDGYSTAGTLGRGLGALRRFSSDYEIYSLTKSGNPASFWHGTAVWARFSNKIKKKAKEISEIETGLFIRPLGDTLYNGDAIYLKDDSSGISWIHLDAVGHGERAWEIIKNIGDVIVPCEYVDDVIKDIDTILKGKKGAMGIAASYNFREKIVNICGVGDINACIVGGGKKKMVPLSEGILGRDHRALKISHIPISEGDLFITASDGLRYRWDPSFFPGLWSRHPQMIAFMLGYLLSRGNDDKSLFILKKVRNYSASLI